LRKERRPSRPEASRKIEDGSGTGGGGGTSVATPVTDALSISAAYGHQDVDEIGDYNTWNIGAKYALSGFTFGATYSDSDAFDNGFTFDETLSKGRFALSVSRSL